jgi:hypothetical protein
MIMIKRQERTTRKGQLIIHHDWKDRQSWAPPEEWARKHGQEKTNDNDKEERTGLIIMSKRAWKD